MTSRILCIALSGMLALFSLPDHVFAGASRELAGTEEGSEHIDACNGYQEMAEGALPATLSKPENMKNLQNIAVSSRAFKDISVTSVKKATKDEGLLTSTDACRKKVIDTYGKFAYCDTTKEVRLLMTPDEGQLRYFNPKLRFSAEKEHIGKSIDGEQISKLSVEVLRLTGIPADEMISKTVIRTMTYAGNTPEGDNVTSPLPAEHHVSVGRVLAGLPVFDSEAKLVMTLKGEIARMALRWPNIVVSKRLESAQAVDPKHISEKIAAMLTNADPSCNGYGEMRMFIAYAEIDEDSPFYGSSDKEDEDIPHSVNHMPALVVYAAPRQQQEGSGVITPPGLQVIIPIFTPADTDPANNG